jgi:UDP-galactopyranose mutase
VHEPAVWYYTPLALPWTRSLRASVVVYDCMDELSAFAGASADLPTLERGLLRHADVVFTGGQSLWEAKRHSHAEVHAFPSAVDVAHFARAREIEADPPDQAPIARPRLGWFGVIDERFDVGLLDAVARRRPEWQIVLVGPLAKIDPSSIPSHPNVHCLGPRAYDELPGYLAGWDVAIMPFARNAATRFISPTKTPEYLAGGRPVVSTSITDVVRPYGERGLVAIADDPDGFVAACEAAMAAHPSARQARVDAFLAGLSWDRTWSAMDDLMRAAASRRRAASRPRPSRTAAPPPPAMAYGAASSSAADRPAATAASPRTAR